MKRGICGILFILIFFYPVYLFADTSSYSYGNPTDSEQAHLEAINRARLNPLAEAALFGIDLNEGLAPSTISAEPVQPLTMNANILAAARNHSADMIANDYFDHYTQSSGDSPFNRMTDEGFNYYSAGENIAYSGSTGVIDEIDTIIGLHESLFVDAGITGRGHRINMLSASFKETGVGKAFGDYRSYTYTYMLTCDFGASSDYTESFVLGVVYNDTNNNNAYDAGEGIDGVTITIDPTSSQTTTASAGGYGIPLPGDDYTITATLSNGTSVAKSITIATANIKVDFLQSEFSSGNSTVDTSADDASADETSGGSNSDGGCFIQSMF